MDGKQDSVSNLNIIYTYHEHEGISDTTANGCYTTPVYHSHESSCYVTCTGTMVRVDSYKAGYPETTFYVLKCNKCGAEDTGTSKNDKPCYIKTTNCGKNTNTLDHYSLGCGKTEDTIESATIIY